MLISITELFYYLDDECNFPLQNQILNSGIELHSEIVKWEPVLWKELPDIIPVGQFGIVICIFTDIVQASGYAISRSLLYWSPIKAYIYINNN